MSLKKEKYLFALWSWKFLVALALSFDPRMMRNNSTCSSVIFSKSTSKADETSPHQETCKFHNLSQKSPDRNISQHKQMLLVEISPNYIEREYTVSFAYVFRLRSYINESKSSTFPLKRKKKNRLWIQREEEEELLFMLDVTR